MMLAASIPYWELTIIKTVVVLLVIPVGALLFGYIFLLKIMAHMQSRMGPMESGGFHGWFQLIGDAIKFVQKEDIIPAEADARVFALAPLVVLMSTFLLYVVVPVLVPATRRPHRMEGGDITPLGAEVLTGRWDCKAIVVHA